MIKESGQHLWYEYSTNDDVTAIETLQRYEWSQGEWIWEIIKNDKVQTFYCLMFSNEIQRESKTEIHLFEGGGGGAEHRP